jgi:AAA family ATP:ADP antiporter
MGSRKGSLAAARPAVVAAVLLVGPQVVAKAARDALFLSAFDVSRLPAMVATAAVVSLVATFAFSAAMARLSPARVLPWSLGASSALFLAEWSLCGPAPRVAAVAVYLHQAILGAMLISGFWSLVNERFDPHAAKRAMGRIGAGASLGGVLGGALTWCAAPFAGPRAMLPVLALTSLLGLASVKAMGAPRASRAQDGSTPLEEAPGPSGLKRILAAPYLRGLASLVVLWAFLETLLDYLLGAAAVAGFGHGGPLLSFFALFHSGAGVLALALQLALAGPALARLGVAGTLAVQPLFVVAGCAMALLSPRLLALALLRGGQAALRNSLFRSSYEMLYTPLAKDEKRSTKVLVDVAFDRLGTVAGSAGVMLVLWLAPANSTGTIVLLVASAAVATLALTPLLQRGYVGALSQGLRTGGASAERETLIDPSALLSLASIHAATARTQVTVRDEPGAVDPVLQDILDLRSGEPERIRRVAGAPVIDPRLVSHLVPLLARDGLFDVVAAPLRRAAPRSTGQLVDALLDPEMQPAVRRRVARLLKDVPTQRAADGLVQALGDARFDIRYRSAQALDHICAREPSLVVPTAVVLNCAQHAATRAAESPRHLGHVFTLLALVLDRPALRIAERALTGPDEPLRGTALEYLENVLPVALRGALWPHLRVGQASVTSGRSQVEIRDELLRSAVVVKKP